MAFAAHSRRVRTPVAPAWVSPAESLARSRRELEADESREERRQSVALMVYVLAGIAISAGYAALFAELDDGSYIALSFVAIGTALVQCGVLVLACMGRRATAGIAAQVIPILPVVLYAWFFSVEAGFTSVLFIGSLGVVVTIPDSMPRTRLAVVAALIGATALVQTVFTRSRALRPPPVDVATQIATSNRTVMTIGLFALAFVVSNRARVSRRLVAASLELADATANTDPLTGLPNRRPVASRLDELAAQGESFAVGVVDIDHFKALNDTFGHDCGDQVLRSVAAAMSRAIRGSDVLARWGGEEFIVIMQGGDTSDVVERLRLAVANSRHEYEGTDHPVTVSVGLAQSAPGERAAETLRRADEALYEAKQAGRNRVVIAQTR